MFKQELSNYVDTVNLRTTVKSTPNVTIPRMIHITTKCPEQQPRPPDFLSSLLGTGDTFLLSLMGSLLGAPFSPITILCPGLGPIYDSIKVNFSIISEQFDWPESVLDWPCWRAVTSAHAPGVQDDEGERVGDQEQPGTAQQHCELSWQWWLRRSRWEEQSRPWTWREHSLAYLRQESVKTTFNNCINLTIKCCQRHHGTMLVLMMMHRTGFSVPGVVTQHWHTLNTSDGPGPRHQHWTHMSQLRRSHHGVANHHGVSCTRHPEHR